MSILARTAQHNVGNGVLATYLCENFNDVCTSRLQFLLDIDSRSFYNGLEEKKNSVSGVMSAYALVGRTSWDE